MKNARLAFGVRNPGCHSLSALHIHRGWVHWSRKDVKQGATVGLCIVEGLAYASPGIDEVGPGERTE